MAATAFTIPARLARPATISKNPAEQKQRVVQLYREWYRGAPEIVSVYSLPVSPAYVRTALRARFEEHRHVTDTRAIDILLLKSRQDYQECMNVWKLPDHVMDMIEKGHRTRAGMGAVIEGGGGAAGSRKGFMQRFYEGRDEAAVRPAASGVN